MKIVGKRNEICVVNKYFCRMNEHNKKKAHGSSNNCRRIVLNKIFDTSLNFSSN